MELDSLLVFFKSKRPSSQKALVHDATDCGIEIPLRFRISATVRIGLTSTSLSRMTSLQNAAEILGDLVQNAVKYLRA
jgi:hypothetical protein